MIDDGLLLLDDCKDTLEKNEGVEMVVPETDAIVETVGLRVSPPG